MTEEGGYEGERKRERVRLLVRRQWRHGGAWLSGRRGGDKYGV